MEINTKEVLARADRFLKNRIAAKAIITEQLLEMCNYDYLKSLVVSAPKDQVILPVVQESEDGFISMLFHTFTKEDFKNELV